MDDDQLKQCLRDDPTPALSPQFPQRVLQRLMPVSAVRGRELKWSLAGLGGALGRRPSTAWRPWVWMLAAVALAWWAQTHVLQPVEDDLYNIDAVGMSSLLTL